MRRTSTARMLQTGDYLWIHEACSPSHFEDRMAKHFRDWQTSPEQASFMMQIICNFFSKDAINTLHDGLPHAGCSTVMSSRLSEIRVALQDSDKRRHFLKSLDYQGRGHSTHSLKGNDRAAWRIASNLLSLKHAYGSGIWFMLPSNWRPL